MRTDGSERSESSNPLSRPPRCGGMARLRGPSHRSVARPFLLLAAVGALLAIGTYPVAASGLTVPAAGSAGTVFVNVSATPQLGFSPDAFTVPPGAVVHLTVTQLSSFPHTFTLSPVANDTIPASDTSSQLTAYFTAHPPLVNLSMGSTANTPYSVTFTAPAAGVYEFVCLYHFSNGMVGKMTSGTSPSGSSGALPTSYLVAGIVVVALVAIAVVLLLRRRPAQPARGAEGPATSPAAPPKTP